MSRLLAQSQRERPPYHFLSIGLAPSDRSVLHARIADRFDAMLTDGLTLTDVVTWTDGGTTLKEATRLADLADEKERP